MANRNDIGAGTEHDGKKKEIDRNPDEGKEDGLLEKAARLIDPPGREVNDEELADPGSNIPDTRPGERTPLRKPNAER